MKGRHDSAGFTVGTGLRSGMGATAVAEEAQDARERRTVEHHRRRTGAHRPGEGLRRRSRALRVLAVGWHRAGAHQLTSRRMKD